jgi:hypothetical protein
MRSPIVTSSRGSIRVVTTVVTNSMTVDNARAAQRPPKYAVALVGELHKPEDPTSRRDGHLHVIGKLDDDAISRIRAAVTNTSRSP